MSIIRWLVSIVVTALVIVGLFAYKDDLNAAHASQGGGEQSATVQSTKAVVTEHQQMTTVNGQVQALQVISLSNELPGKIAKLSFKSGDLVKKGQVLLELDHSEEHARLIAAKSNVELYTKTLGRYKKLLKQSKISEESVDQAEASLRNAQSQVALFQSYIDKKTIVAPFTAKAGIHNLQIGQYLDQNTLLTHLIGVNEFIWVDFSVPQIYNELAADEVVSIQSDQLSRSAKVVSVEPMLSSESRHLRYRAKIDNTTGWLKHNQLVKVTLPIGGRQSKVAVPDIAVNKSQLGSFVYLLKADENGDFRAHKQSVVLGERVGDMVVIDEGLQEGQLIAGKGTFKLRPGLKVFFAQTTEQTQAKL